MNDTSTISPASRKSFAVFRHPPDVFDTVGVGKAEVAIEAVTDVVPVKKVGVAAEKVQLLLDQIGDRRLAGAGQSE